MKWRLARLASWPCFPCRVTSTDSTVFKLNTDGSGYTVLYTFTDTPPPNVYYSLLAGADGALYGTTFYDSDPRDLGTVFRLSRDGTGYAQLYSFTSSSGDGAYPAGSLIQGRDGDLYGTTTAGGLIINGIFYNNGTVFKLKPDGTGYTLLYNFTGTLGDGGNPSAGVIQGSDGALYGTAGGGTFKLNTDGTGYTLLHAAQESSPSVLLQGDDGALYGTTANVGNGAVFKLNTDGTGYTILHGFSGGSTDGVDPTALLQGSDGALYGTTESGGTNYAGTIFRLNTDGSGYTILYSFPWEMGSPVALVQGSDGTLYGMAVYLDLYGAVFKLNTDGSQFVTIHDFSGSLDGNLNNTTGGLVQGSDGLLYGTTPIGGTNGSGTIFKLSTDGTGYTVLYSFRDSGGDGGYPGGGLVQGKDGAFYGTTQRGGNNGEGLFFRLGAVPPAQLTQLAPSAAGAFQLTLAGVPYVAWRIQAATNLSPPVTWLTLTNLTTTNGTAKFTDPGTTNFLQRFYRALWP